MYIYISLLEAFLILFLILINNFKIRKYLSIAFLLAISALIYSIYGIVVSLFSYLLLYSILYFYNSKNYLMKTLPFIILFIIAIEYPFYTIQGFLFSIAAFSSLLKSKGKSEKIKEINRDLFQLTIGFIIILSYFFLRENFSYLLFLVIVIGFYLGSLISTNKSNPLYKFERSGVTFGSGAIWLGEGLLFSIMFLNNDYLILVIIALFFGDTLSTIVGVNFGRHRIKYNKKSLEGSIAMFLLLFLISVILISPVYAIIYAALATLLELFSKNIDDNLLIAIGLTLFFLFCHPAFLLYL